MTPRSVLVVDDDRDLAQTFVDILELNGWPARAVHSGEEALDEVAKRRPDAILMDIRMPGIDGVEALRRILAREPSARVILMTAFLDREVEDTARREGALEVLEKPVAPRHLLGILENAADGSS